jgi:hypothetical protein
VLCYYTFTGCWTEYLKKYVYVLSVYISLLSVLNFFSLFAEAVSQYIIAVIVTYGVGRTVWSLNPDREETIFLFSKLPTSSLGPHSPQFSGYLGYFQDVDRPGHEVDYSPPYSTSIMNEWSYTPYSNMPLKHEQGQLPVIHLHS